MNLSEMLPGKQGDNKELVCQGNSQQFVDVTYSFGLHLVRSQLHTGLTNLLLSKKRHHFLLSL